MEDTSICRNDSSGDSRDKLVIEKEYRRQKLEILRQDSIQSKDTSPVEESAGKLCSVKSADSIKDDRAAIQEEIENHRLVKKQRR